MPEDLVVVLITAVAALLVALLILNLSIGDKQVHQRIERLYKTRDPQFRRTMGAILGQALLPGNQVQELLNGDQIFPAMLDAIRSARYSITLETFIFWQGKIGREFVDALTERACKGVRVHLLLDWVGYTLDDSQIAFLRAHQVAIRRYNRPRWNALHLLNSRTHRKLMIVDGRIGFTGGVGIADEWLGRGRERDEWRDTQFRVEGPVVAQMQAAFTDNWTQTTGEVLHSEEYFPELAPAGPALAQMFTSSPGGGAESMQLMFLLSIGSASESIRLSASYFIPDPIAVNTLVTALERGVRVQIIVPGPHMDKRIVRRASRSRWGRLLRAGAEIYEYQPCMYHVKVIIVDDVWMSVGSTNFDSRSFSINDEANLNVYDAGFAQRQAAVFDDDLRRSRRVTLEQWESRPWHDKLRDRVASLFGPQL